MAGSELVEALKLSVVAKNIEDIAVHVPQESKPSTAKITYV